MTRKIISLFLCAAFATGSLALLASCSDQTDKKGNAGVSGSDKISEKVPDDLSFANLSEEERTINIAYVEGGNGTFTEHSLVVDESNMDPTDQVDLAVQRRNQTVESQLGVILYANAEATDIGGLTAAIEGNIVANDGLFDVVAGYQYYSIGMAKKSLLLNLANLGSLGPDGTNADYIDFDASYWGTAYNDALSYKGAYYWITGDLALRYMGGMYCTFVNSDIYTAKLEATYGSIYDIAKKGEWTLDLLMEMAALCYEDDGDDTANDADTFGFGYELCDMIDGMVFASNVQFSAKDPNTGDVKIVFNSDHTLQFAAKLSDLLSNKAYAYNYGNADNTIVMPAFAEGKIAFTVNKIYQSQVYLNELENFYLIPAPKLNVEQANYVTGIHDGCTIFGIPVDCTKVPQTAATLELLAAYSEEYVKPAYYESALKYRYTRDPEAAVMIELIHSNTNTDFAAAWSESINNIVHTFRSESEVGSSTLARNKKTWQNSVDDLTEILEECASNAAI